jgi:hypothetical protein
LIRGVEMSDTVRKTILIWDQCGEKEIEFYILKGDYRHLNKVMINSTRSKRKLQDELAKLMYADGDGGGHALLKPEKEFPYDAVKKGYPVIVAGFLP